MNDRVMLPIEVSREGDQITKVCVEDIYKLQNRIIATVDKAYNNIQDIINSINKSYLTANEDVVSGELIVGTGKSQPCGGDVFDEAIGNEIAFRKAKLSANIKKLRYLHRILNELAKAELKVYNEEIEPLTKYCMQDTAEIQKYNPDFDFSWF